MALKSSGTQSRQWVVVLCLIVFCSWSAFERSCTTVLDDGLSATPWQRWKRWPNRITLSRAAKILHCNGVPCPEVLGGADGQQDNVGVGACPAYFEWIDRDLKTWEEKGGISQLDVHLAQRDAAFRVIIVDGKLYVDSYYSCHTGRATFNIWGLLMLLERFPGQVDDADIMFNCADRPRVFPRQWWMKPRPLFGYSTTRGSLDIPFPDWSFWAWPEKGITHWEKQLNDIVHESASRNWTEKEPFAYWKGNFRSSETRVNLLKCNSSDQLHLYSQDWQGEASNGFKNSNLSKQCNDRYKIYAEGNAWSVGYKYTLACGSTVLSIDNKYNDFFSRALKPFVHYIPITSDRDAMCEYLTTKLAWLNAHPLAAEKIGRQGQEFIRNEVSMERVYDYMFHLLSRYSKLQKFKPSVPPTAKRVCPERIKCLADPELRKTIEALPRPSPSTACSMPTKRW